LATFAVWNCERESTLPIGFAETPKAGRSPEFLLAFSLREAFIREGDHKHAVRLIRLGHNLLMRVLVIEDEVRLAENVASALREGPGFAVDCAEDGEMGKSLSENSCYDLIILDLMLPKLDGLSVLKDIRRRKEDVPVLILTARSEVDSTIKLLNAGADDYLSKPFDLGELLARVKALIRRGKGVTNPTLQIGELVINTLEQTAYRSGKLVGLSGMEYRIIEYLMHRPRAVVSKQELLEHLYDFNWEHHSNVIEAHISNLRRKISSNGGAPEIETLRGRGYRLIISTAEREYPPQSLR
jgi:two-component system response regulator PhoP